MSRNALFQCILLLAAAGMACPAASPLSTGQTNRNAPVVIVRDTRATAKFLPNAAIVRDMVNRGLMRLAGEKNPAAAWRSLVSTQDIIGIKVFSAAGQISGTRPAVAAAVVRGLLEAGVPKDHIIIWDKHLSDLRLAGFYDLSRRLGVRLAGSVDSGYDPTNFYLPDSPIIGRLVYGDLEFGKKGKNVGKKSFVSLLLSRRLTKIISIAPLLSQNSAGVCGQLYSVAMGSVDNTFRFRGNPGQLAVAVPEIYALPSVGGRVVLNVTDALLGQYEGGPAGYLQYSQVLNQLWFSRDPVALDTLAVTQLKQERRERRAPEMPVNSLLYANAALLELGVNDPSKIKIETINQ
ncbi:MAG: DUF362 domain-containing protein [Verrucomicrobia bacterium]|nr:DUF362 domain-containing protein [Verrucomicrobiota bacterium]MDE3098389.1 DUF362 domain-containing protein [Verrucomicrobiota bacterium]